MSYQLFSATGCMRCNIVKSYMKERAISFEELDIKADGKDAFKQFYKENRSQIFRGKEGVEFPLLFDGRSVVQGAGPILFRLGGRERLDPFVSQNQLSEGWIGGVNLHAGTIAPGSQEESAFLDALEHLHAQGLKIRLETDGRNPGLLRRLAEKQWVSHLDFLLRGPAELYKDITGEPMDAADLADSLVLVNRFDAYGIILPVCAFVRPDGGPGFIEPEEAAQAAAFAETATGSKTHPFFIRPVTPPEALGLSPLEAPAFFKYRTRCRRFMVKCEIEKG